MENENLPLAEKRRAVTNQTVRICYIVTGACAGSFGIFTAEGLAQGTAHSWIAAGISAIICLIFLWWAVELDEEE